MTLEDEEQLQSIVYFLSDHVCTAIEAAEALYTQNYAADQALSNQSAHQILQGLDEFHRFIDRIRHYEYLILTHLNQARHWSIQLRSLDSDFRPVLDLFSSATNIASDANGVLGEDEDDVFNGAGEPLHFVESRALSMTEDENGGPTKISVDDNYLLGGKILLSGLIEVCETFHDTMATRYAVFNDDQDDANYESGGILRTSSDN